MSAKLTTLSGSQVRFADFGNVFNWQFVLVQCDVTFSLDGGRSLSRRRGIRIAFFGFVDFFPFDANVWSEINFKNKFQKNWEKKLIILKNYPFHHSRWGVLSKKLWNNGESPKSNGLAPAIQITSRY